MSDFRCQAFGADVKRLVQCFVTSFAMAASSGSRAIGLFTPFHAAQMVEKARWAAEAFSTFGRAEIGDRRSRWPMPVSPRRSATPNGRSRKPASALSSTRSSRTRRARRGCLSGIATRISPGFRIDAAEKIIEIATARRRRFRAHALHQSDRHALLQGDDLLFSPAMRSSSRRTRWRKACSIDAAQLLAQAAEDAGAPDGVIQVIPEPSIADHRPGDEVGPHRPHSRDRRIAGGARRLFVRQSGARRRARQCARLCR